MLCTLVSTHNWVNGPKIALVEQESGWQEAVAAERVKPVEDNNVENRLVRLCDKVFPIAMWLDPWAKMLLVHNITIQSNWIIHMQICKWETPKTRIRGNKTAFLFFLSDALCTSNIISNRIFFMYTRRSAAVPYATISLRPLARKRIAERTFAAYVKNSKRVREIQQTELVIYEFVVCTAVRFSVY